MGQHLLCFFDGVLYSKTKHVSGLAVPGHRSIKSLLAALEIQQVIASMRRGLLACHIVKHFPETIRRGADNPRESLVAQSERPSRR